MSEDGVDTIPYNYKLLQSTLFFRHLQGKDLAEEGNSVLWYFLEQLVVELLYDHLYKVKPAVGLLLSCMSSLQIS